MKIPGTTEQKIVASVLLILLSSAIAAWLFVSEFINVRAIAAASFVLTTLIAVGSLLGLITQILNQIEAHNNPSLEINEIPDAVDSKFEDFKEDGQMSTIRSAGKSRPPSPPKSPSRFDNSLEIENPSVGLADQTVHGERIVIERIDLPDGGYVTIHDDSISDKPIDSIRGHSQYLPPGIHRNVPVALFDPFNDTQHAVAVINKETNGNHRYDFIHTTGQNDAPYLNDSEEIVLDSATAVVP